MRYWVLGFVFLVSVILGVQAECAPKKNKAALKNSATAGLTSSDSSQIRESIKAIKKSKKNRDMGALKKRIEQGLPPDILLEAVDVIISTPKTSTLVELSSHRNPEVRKKVINALSRKKSRKSLMMLVGLLDDQNHSVRAEAARAIGNSAPGPGMKHLLNAAEQGLPEAGQVIGEKAPAAEVRALIRTINKKNLKPLIPTCQLLASRRDLPYKLKLSLIDKLAQIDSADSRNLLTTLANSLSKWDPLKLASTKAHEKITRGDRAAEEKPSKKQEDKDATKPADKKEAKQSKKREDKSSTPPKSLPRAVSKGTKSKTAAEKPKNKPAAEKPKSKTAAEKPKNKPAAEKPKSKTAAEKPKNKPTKESTPAPAKTGSATSPKTDNSKKVEGQK